MVTSLSKLPRSSQVRRGNVLRPVGSGKAAGQSVMLLSGAPDLRQGQATPAAGGMTPPDGPRGSISVASAASPQETPRPGMTACLAHAAELAVVAVPSARHRSTRPRARPGRLQGPRCLLVTSPEMPMARRTRGGPPPARTGPSGPAGPPAAHPRSRGPARAPDQPEGPDHAEPDAPLTKPSDRRARGARRDSRRASSPPSRRPSSSPA